MQRRAAAAYVALFLVVGAGAYAVTGVAEQPQVEMDGPTYSVGDELTVDDRTYTFVESDTLEWTDPDATESQTLENGSSFSWQTVSWDGQAVESRTISVDDTVRYNGSDHTIAVNTTVDPSTVTFQRADDASINDTYEVGEQVTLSVDGQYLPGRTITGVTDSEVTVAVGDEYRLSVSDDPDPDSAEFVQEFNVTRRLVEDPTVYNETTTIEGVEYVTNRTTDQNRRLDTYLPDPEIHAVAEEDTLTYQGAEWTVGNITAGTVPLERTVTANNSVTLADGSSVALGPNDAEYLVHLPDNSSAQVLENTTSNWNAYQSELTVIDNYNERMSGLWGIVYLCFFATLVLGAAAFLPVKD